MTFLELRQQIDRTLETFTAEELILANQLLETLKAYFESTKSLGSSNIDRDPLEGLRNSDFVGCFSAESDLAQNSKAILQTLKQDDYR